MTFAAGLATEGCKPFCAIYSTFLQRAYDQVVHDVAIQNLPVRFAIDRAGLVGADGPTHAGSFDVAYLGCLPNFVIMAAADEAELVAHGRDRRRHRRPPSALRYPRGEGVGVEMPAERHLRSRSARAASCAKARKVAILSLGTRLAGSLKAAEQLAAFGLSTTVADARFAKPLDPEPGRRLAQEPRGADHRRGRLHRRLRRVRAARPGGGRAARSGPQGAPHGAARHVHRYDAPARMHEQAGLTASDIVPGALRARARPCRKPRLNILTWGAIVRRARRNYPSWRQWAVCGLELSVRGRVIPLRNQGSGAQLLSPKAPHAAWASAYGLGLRQCHPVRSGSQADIGQAICDELRRHRRDRRSSGRCSARSSRHRRVGRRRLGARTIFAMMGGIGALTIIESVGRS